MNREGVIWIAIRVFGVYLLVCGALEVPRLFSSSYGVYWSWSWYRMHMNQASEYTPEAEEAFDEVFVVLSWSRTMSKVLTEFSGLVLFMGCGIYCVRRGRLVLAVLDMGNPLLETEDDSEAPHHAPQEG